MIFPYAKQLCKGKFSYMHGFRICDKLCPAGVLMWSDKTRQRSMYLVFNILRKAVCGIVKNERLLPATIGVYGDWGGGKSSLIQMATAELEKDEDIVVLSFKAGSSK